MAVPKPLPIRFMPREEALAWALCEINLKAGFKLTIEDALFYAKMMILEEQHAIVSDERFDLPPSTETL